MSSAQRIVICGAGIAGVAAAYNLAVVQGASDVTLIEADTPLSMTSDKSTEAYRNWWPGPDAAMTQFMDRSIDFIEDLARATNNRINLNRRGYLFASADANKAQWLIDMARLAETRGAGPVRVHDSGTNAYEPHHPSSFDTPLTGADILTSSTAIRQHFPYLNPETKLVAHVRRAGWLSAQQLGMTMLEAARAKGVKLVRGTVKNIDIAAQRVQAVQVATPNGHEKLEATHVVLATGPLTKALATQCSLDLPIFAERHLKISLADTARAIPRDAPMLIWLDSQRLPWSKDEHAALLEDDATRWLTDEFPWGVHGRPDGTGTTVLMLYNYENHATDVVFPLPEHDHYGEITLRGMSTMVPGLQTYVDRGARPYIDGGYYVKTHENRPLIGPTKIGGLYVSCAYSGFGIMASCAGGDLIARHVLGKPLPDYAPAFMLSRYEDADYRALLAQWGDGGQL